MASVISFTVMRITLIIGLRQFGQFFFASQSPSLIDANPVTVIAVVCHCLPLGVRLRCNRRKIVWGGDAPVGAFAQIYEKDVSETLQSQHLIKCI